MVSDLESVAAGFLIAAPTLGDPNFDHTVVLICAHNDEGAMGLVINRPAPLSTGEVMEQIGISCPKEGSQTVLIGGPVALETGLVLYVSDDGRPAGEDEYHVSDQLRLSPNQDLLRAIAAGGGPSPFQLFLGHSGWAPGQIESEIAQGAWIPGHLQVELIFGTPLDQRWEAALSAEGISPAVAASTFRRQTS